MKAYAASMRSTGCWERLKHRSSGGVARRETPVRDYRWQGRPKHCERLALCARHGEDAHAQHFQEDGNQDPPRAAAAILEELATQKRRGISSPLASFLGFYPQGSVPSVVSGLDAHGSLSTTALVLTTSQSSKKKSIPSGAKCIRSFPWQSFLPYATLVEAALNLTLLTRSSSITSAKQKHGRWP